MIVNTARTGAIAEVTAANYFLMQGYDVFFNICVTGPVDLVIWKEGETPMLIDVKTLGWSQRVTGKWTYYAAKLTKRHIDLGIKIVYVDIERQNVSFDPATLPPPT